LSVADGKKARRKAAALGLDVERDLCAGKTEILPLKRGATSGRGTTLAGQPDEPGGSSSFSPAISLVDPDAAWLSES
jgi:hypothetical protein